MLRRPLGGWIFTFAVMALFAGSALAQQPGGGRRPGGFGGGGFGGPGGGPGGGSNEMSLLGSEQVQKELELLPDQIEDLTKLRESTSRPDFSLFQGLRELPEEERNKKLEEIRAKQQETQKANLEKINTILLPHQAERLKGISIQVRGAAVLEDPAIADELKISEEQKQKITSTREAQREKVTALFQQGGGGGGQDEAAREAMREKFTSLRKENDEALMAILTSEQREQLEKMKGEKFEVDMSQLGRGPGGPGGGQTRFGGNRRPGEGGERRPGGDRPGGDRPSNRPTNDEPKP